MKKGILGKKIGMTQIFAEDGRLIPVTVVEAVLFRRKLLKKMVTVLFRLVSATKRKRTQTSL